MDFSDTPGWRGWVLIDVNAVAIGLSTLFVGIRMYVRARMTKNLGMDDALAGVSFVCQSLSNWSYYHCLLLINMTRLLWYFSRH